MTQQQRIKEYLESGKTAAHNRKDMTGHIFGELTVIKYSHTDGKKSMWQCLCSCGKLRLVVGTALRSGNTKSCGHNRQKNMIKQSRLACTIHGMEGTRTYSSWRAMKERCLSKNHKSYDYYKNVKICHQWVNSFANFYKDMGVRPEGKTLDRIDNDKGYSKCNCKWSTPKQQANNRRNSIFIELDGETKTIAQWADYSSMGSDTLSFRLKNGWSIKDAITKPVKKQKNNR